MNNSYTQEEKEAFLKNVTKWKSELVKLGSRNIFVHPDNPWKPYYVIKEGKWFKHKPYTVMNGQIKYTKNGESEFINVSKITEMFSEPVPDGFNEAPF